MSEWSLSAQIETIRKSKVLKACIVSVIVYFFFRFLFTLIAPFALAFLLITLCYPILSRVQKKIPVKKKFLAVGIIVPLLLLIMGLLWTIMVFGVRQLDGLPDFCTRVGEQMEFFFHQSCGRLDGKFGWDGQEIEHYIIEQMTVVMENVQIQVVPQILSSSYSCFKGIFSVIGFLAITCIAAFLLEKDYTAAVKWLKFFKKSCSLIWAVIEGVLSYIITFIKAQGVILCIVSVLCGATLYIGGVERRCIFRTVSRCSGYASVYRNRNYSGAVINLAVSKRTIRTDGGMYRLIWGVYFSQGVVGTQADWEENRDSAGIDVAGCLCGGLNCSV